MLFENNIFNEIKKDKINNLLDIKRFQKVGNLFYFY